MAKNKAKDIISSISSSNRPTRGAGSSRATNSSSPAIIIGGGSIVQQKAISKIACTMDALVEATGSTAGMDVIPETAYVDLASQIAATPDNAITKNTNTGDVVIKDKDSDYIVIAGGAIGAIRNSQTVSVLVNTPLMVTHNLGVIDVVVSVRDDITNEIVYPSVTIVDANNISIESTVAIDLRVTCI